MSKLPAVPPLTETVQVGGEDVTYRALSRSEAVKVTMAFPNDPDGAEVFILACGVDVSEDEARAWRDATDATEAGKVIDGIVYLSKLATRPGEGGKEGPLPQP